MTKKVILVTGGNRGIGKEIYKQLTALGHIVLLGSRSLKKGIEVTGKIKGDLRVMKLDMTNEKEMQYAAQYIKDKYGYLDVLINNAGIMSSTDGAIDVVMDEVKKTLETNFFGPWRLTQALLSLLKKSTDGRVINISSGMGAIEGMSGGHAGYRLSKTALNGLTALFASELLGQVKVFSMCPGWVRTDMGGLNATRSVKKGAETAIWLATEKNIPTGKFFRDKQVIPW